MLLHRPNVTGARSGRPQTAMLLLVVIPRTPFHPRAGSIPVLVPVHCGAMTGSYARSTTGCGMGRLPCASDDFSSDYPAPPARASINCRLSWVGTTDSSATASRGGAGWSSGVRIARTSPPVKFPHVSNPNEATPKSEIADAIREAFISYPVGVGCRTLLPRSTRSPVLSIA